PFVGVMMPARQRSVVVFPAPFGPTSPRISPGPTSNVTPRTAVKSPYNLVSAWAEITYGALRAHPHDRVVTHVDLTAHALDDRRVADQRVRQHGVHHRRAAPDDRVAQLGALESAARADGHIGADRRVGEHDVILDVH